jgi:predicted PurR-regulated permease PerM
VFQLRAVTYLGSLMPINVGLGVVTTAALSLPGLPNPLMWGVAAAPLNFVPYVGPSIMLGLLGLAGLLAFDTLAPTLLVLAAFLAITTVEGQLVQHSALAVPRR